MICLFSWNTITNLVGFCVFAFTHCEKQGELMVRSLYQVGTLTVINT